MDKLKPVIQHHFWILFGLVLILPLVGWMPAVNQFSQQTAERINEIEQANSKIPRGPQANATWGEQLNTKAEMAEQKNQDARYGLWKRQLEMMVWPNTIKKDLQPKNYRDEISPIARNIYKNNYLTQVRAVWKKADPFIYDTGKGTIVFDEALMPAEQFGDLTPTSEQVWNAQEDLWLMESLLKSIRRANADSSLITDSLVRSLKVIKLVGGPGNYPQAENTMSMDSGMGGSPDEFMMDPGMEDPGLFGMGGMGQSMNVGPGSVSFNPADEFGQEQGRYIDFEEGTVFKKRGFYLEAVIDHQRLPELLTSLTNNSWPVTITRVQMAQLNSSTTPLMGSSMGSGMGMEMDMGMSPEAYDMSMSMPMDSGYGSSMGSRQQSAQPGRLNTTNNPAGQFAPLAKAAEFGPNLATVAISGVIYLYNPPENLQELQNRANAPAAPVNTPAGTTPESPATVEPSLTEPTPEANPAEMPAPADNLPSTDDLPAADDLSLTPDVPADSPAVTPDTPAAEAPAADTPAVTPEVPETPEPPALE